MASNSSTSSGRISWMFFSWRGFINVPLLLCKPWAHLDIDDHIYDQIVSGLDVACVLVCLLSTYDEPWCGRLFKLRNLVAPLQLSERVLCPSMFHESSILLSSELSKLFLLASRRQCILTEFGMMTFSVHTIVLWAWHGGEKVIHQACSRSLPLLP